MKVLLVSCVFPPEPLTSAQTSGEIAEELAKCGHEVTVVAPFPSRPAGGPYQGYSRSLYRRYRDQKGYDLIRTFSFFSRTSSLPSRFLENISFGISGAWAVCRQKKPDVIYSNTWPLVATGILALVASWRRIPLVISVQDAYPQSLISQGRINESSALASWMRRIDRAITRRCREIVVISPRFATLYLEGHGVDARRVHVVPNWMRRRELASPGRIEQFRNELGIPPNAFVVAYGGNVGVAAGVETVIEAFQRLTGIPNLYLVVAGSGSRLQACREAARSIRDVRVIFRSPWLPEETEPLLGMADVLVLPTSGRQSLASTPSKVIGYLLAGRPVITLAVPDSDLADMINMSGCGWVVEPDCPDLLAEEIRRVVGTSAEERCSKGLAGRKYALENLTSNVCLPQVIRILETVAGSSGGGL